MKRRRTSIAAVVGIGLCIVLVVSLWLNQREPEYEGKTLSQWLAQNRSLKVTLSADSNSREAVRRIGTNAFPYLIRWLSYQRPAWKDRLLASYRAFPQPLIANSMQTWLSRGKDDDLADAATTCFEILGPDAATLVPDLTCLLKTCRTPATAKRIIRSLGLIGPKASPALPALSAFAHKYGDVGTEATIAIHNIQVRDGMEDRR